MHVHTYVSPDGLNTPRSVKSAISQKRIDAVAITDHDRYSAWESFKKEDIPFIPGVEKTIKEEDGNKFHMLVYFLNEPLPDSYSFDVIIDSVREQDAIAVIAHPYDVLRKAPRDPRVYVDRVDGYEVFNARISAEYMNYRALKLADEFNKLKTGGGDSHHPSELGSGYIEVDCDDLECVRAKLKEDNVRVGGERSPIYVHAYSYLRRMGILKPKF